MLNKQNGGGEKENPPTSCKQYHTLESTQLPILFWSEMSSSGSTNGLSSSSSCPALIHLSFIICYEKKKKS